MEMLTRGIRYNERVEYLIRDNTYKGLRGVDFRRFVMSKPTGSGIVIPVEQWNEFFIEILKFNDEIELKNKIKIDVSNVLEEYDIPVESGSFVKSSKKRQLETYMKERKKEKKNKKLINTSSIIVPVKQTDGSRNKVRNVVESIFLES